MLVWLAVPFCCPSCSVPASQGLPHNWWRSLIIIFSCTLVSSAGYPSFWTSSSSSVSLFIWSLFLLVLMASLCFSWVYFDWLLVLLCPPHQYLYLSDLYSFWFLWPLYVSLGFILIGFFFCYVFSFSLTYSILLGSVSWYVYLLSELWVL